MVVEGETGPSARDMFGRHGDQVDGLRRIAWEL